jgi:hypothetical protein
LESELDKAQASPSPKGTPIKPKAPPIDFFYGVSPPGPQSIFLPPSDSASDSSSPRRFVHTEESADESTDDEAAHRRSNRLSIGSFSNDPSPFDPPSNEALVLEEILGDSMEFHPIGDQSSQNPDFGNDLALGAISSASSSHSANPTAPSSSRPSSSYSRETNHPPKQGSSAPSSSASEAKKSNGHDPRTERLIWLFNGIKQYCESAEFKRAVNLLGKTADLVETQAKSLWSYIGWGSSTSSQPAASQIPVGPPDTELTLTLLVVRTNWYGRDQYRFLRLEQTAFVRLRADNFEECERTPYEHLVAAQVTGSTIKFRYSHGETTSEIAYNFGDAEVARMIAEALKFLKGKGSVAVSYVGN